MDYWKHHLLVALTLVGFSTDPHSRADDSLFTADFNSPDQDAEVQKGFSRTDKNGKPLDSGGVERALVIRKGQWETPPIAVKPFEFYRIQCRTKGAESCFVSVTFFDSDDAPHVADVYDLLDVSEDWAPYELCVRGRVNSVRMRVRFHVGNRPLSLDDVRVEPVSATAVATWADTLASQVPVLRYRPPTTRGSLLPKTMTRLREGGRLRIVILGDSICNDTSNSNFEALLQRAYPRSQIEIVTSVLGNTGCQYYKEDDRVEQFALRFKPDLLAIGGISHRFDVEAIRSVIRQVRAGSDCEVMVMSGPVTPHEIVESFAYRAHRGPRSELLRRMETFPDDLRRMTSDEKVEFLDMRAAWDDYMLRSYRPQEWFLRDIIHANSRGKQVLGRILSRYLAP